MANSYTLDDLVFGLCHSGDQFSEISDQFVTAEQPLVALRRQRAWVLYSDVSLGAFDFRLITDHPSM
jgi:hypothetical protein